MSKLSRRQNSRLGGLLTVLGGKTPYDQLLCELKLEGLVFEGEQGLALTEKGLNEKDRLSILAGLMTDRDYVTDRGKTNA